VSRDGSIGPLPWADGDYSFRLAWGELVQLQEACDAGPLVILSRLGGGSWKVQEIAAVIRLGLIGGGTAPADALRLTRDYVEARPPMENTSLAYAVLGAALQGVPDEPPGEAPGEETGDGSTTSPTESSA
jgi:hypothetical protein